MSNHLPNDGVPEIGNDDIDILGDIDLDSSSDEEMLAHTTVESDDPTPIHSDTVEDEEVDTVSTDVPTVDVGREGSDFVSMGPAAHQQISCTKKTEIFYISDAKVRGAFRMMVDRYGLNKSRIVTQLLRAFVKGKIDQSTAEVKINSVIRLD